VPAILDLEAQRNFKALPGLDSRDGGQEIHLKTGCRRRLAVDLQASTGRHEDNDSTG
jgi:hypothetical protein